METDDRIDVMDRTDVSDEDDTDFEEPKDFHLIGWNDDYTTQEFVVGVLRETCHRSAEDAERIMMDVHTKGRGIMWTGIHDIALTKSTEITDLARRFKFPFRTTVEEV